MTMEELAQDVKQAWRGLRRAPGFAVTAVVVLALGIGANTAVFSAVRTVLLDPPPYPEPERLVVPKLVQVKADRADTTHMPWSYPKFERLREGLADVVEPLGGYAARTMSLTEPGSAERMTVEVVTPGYLHVLGVRPRVGRLFSDVEGATDTPPGVVLISHALWRSRFAGSPDAVGRTVVLNGSPLRVVGVLPFGFRGLTGSASAWIPVGDAGQILSSFMVKGAQAHWMHAVGRLKPGITLQDARARSRQVGGDIEAEMPLADPGAWVGADALAFLDVWGNEAAERSVLVLSGAALLVLLIAASNLAVLLLARGRSRRRETAVRLAMGSGRWRVARGQLVESLLLATLGSVVGLVLAYWGIEGIAAAWPDAFLAGGSLEAQVVDVARISMDGVVLGFGVAVGLLTGLLFGALPALSQSDVSLVSALKEGGATVGSRGGSSGGGGGQRLLVGAQLALALILLVGAGLMGGSLLRLNAVELGFDPDDVLVFRYATERGEGDAWDFHRAFLERIRSLPAVEAATLAAVPPLGGYSSITLVREVEGRPPFGQGEGPAIGVNYAGPDLFRTAGIELLEGRRLEPSDATDRPEAVVISRAAVEELFEGGPAVARTFRMGISFGEGDDNDLYRVVGVVDDVLYGRPEDGAMPMAYLPMESTGARSATVMVRTRGEPFDLIPAMRELAAGLDADLPLYRFTTSRDMVAEDVSDTRVLLGLLALFALVALLVAATGLYGIVAKSVADRRRELGLRMALGAGRGRVQGLVLRQGVATAAAGLVVGLGGAWLASRSLDGVLFDVSAHDPRAFGGAAGLLLLVALLATWLPARRATRLDPSEALRAE